MSYLVDALKKAERERHAQRHSDLRTAASAPGEQASGQVAHLLYGVVAVLVLFNLGLVAYLWWPSHQAPSVPVLDGSQTRADGRLAPAEVATAPAVGDDSAESSPSSAQPSGKPISGLRLSDDVPDADPATAAGDDTGADTPAHGSVTYAQTPLDRSSAPSFSKPESAPSPQQDTGGQVPDVIINGQLYSSVPGRSFILVDGVRYHEGERLASGPAIQSIDADGATLIYHGQRYHVRGPG